MTIMVPADWKLKKQTDYNRNELRKNFGKIGRKDFVKIEIWDETYNKTTVHGRQVTIEPIFSGRFIAWFRNQPSWIPRPIDSSTSVIGRSEQDVANKAIKLAERRWNHYINER